jgi:glucokinase
VTQVLAVDYGGTKTTLAVIDDKGDVRERVKMPAAHSVDESVRQIASTLEAFGPVSAVGVIVPGIYTAATGYAWCPNLWGRDEVPFGSALRDRVRVPAVIDNDRAGYVLGESWLGVARGLNDVVFVAIGTGIGVGIFSGGRFVSGVHGVAGAAGWFALDSKWREEYGRSGCWESESAGPAIAQRFAAADAAAVISAARQGDGRARDVLAHAARYIGMGVANLISVLNPAMVVLGGGIMQGAGDMLIDEIRLETARWAQPIAASRCAIELTQLGENAGLFGAARLALTRTLTLTLTLNPEA